MLVSWLNYRVYQGLRFKVFWIEAVGQTTPTGLFCKNSNVQNDARWSAVPPRVGVFRSGFSNLS